MTPINVLLLLLLQNAAQSATIAPPKICRLHDFVMRRRAPPGTPPFLHTPQHFATCNSLILDRHELPKIQEILAIFKVLPNTYITSLHLLGVPLSVDVVVHLAAYVATSRLQTLHLFDLDDLDETGFVILSKAMKDNIYLERIILANMFRNIGPEAGFALRNMLSRHPTVHHIDVRGFKGGTELINVIIGAIQNPSIKSVCLRQIGLNVTGLLRLARSVSSVSSTSKLEHLDLSGNQLGDNGANIIAHRLLRENVDLVELDLSANDVTDVGASNLAMSLEENSHLHHLMLNDNPGITSGGVAEFVDMLIDPYYGNQMLTSLEFTPSDRARRGSPAGSGGDDKISEEVLQDLEMYLERNQKRETRIVPVPRRKDWPHEGSVSGLGRSLIGVSGKKDFNRVSGSGYDPRQQQEQRMRRSIGRGEL